MNESFRVLNVDVVNESMVRDCYYIVSGGYPMVADALAHNLMHDVNGRGHKMFMAVNPRTDYILGFISGYNICQTSVINFLFVDKKYHGRGIGRALLNAYEAHARAGAQSKVVVESTYGAIAFYARHGFTRAAGQNKLQKQL